MAKIPSLLLPRGKAAVSLITVILSLAFAPLSVGQNPHADTCHMDSSGFCITGEAPSSPASVPHTRISSTVESSSPPQDKSAVALHSPAVPKLDVEFHNGLLQIIAENVSLKETLRAVSARIVAEVQFPVGTLDDHVFVHLGPGTPQ